jgi:hypothetical protein
MSLKEKIENNPVLLVLGLLLTGFISGMGSYRGLLEMVDATTPPPSAQVSDTATASELDQVLEENKRLQAKLQQTQDDCGRLAGQFRVQIAQLQNKLGMSRAEREASLSESEPGVRPSAAARVEEGGGLRVELSKCSLRGDKVSCNFSVTSTTKDRTQYLRGSRLIERDGNELRASGQQFGSSTSEGGQVYASLVRNVPMRVTVTFDAVDAELSRSGVSLIELQFDDLAAQFRDIHPD